MRRITLMCVCLCMILTTMLAQDNSTNQKQVFGQDFVQGLEAYKVGAWEDALFFLKRTSNFQDASSDTVWYFVIMAEVNLGDYAAVLRDGTTFLEMFPKSTYIAEISYETVYAQYELGMYDDAIKGFTTFASTHSSHEMVPFSVYYTGEALYNVYEFTRAKQYFDKIIIDYPDSSIYDDALFRLELLKQREREEKLLYLLRVTGEEAVAAKEDYERQIKQLQSEESLILSKRVQELEQSVNKLQVEKEELEIQNTTLKNTVQELNSVIAENTMKEVEVIEVQVETNNDLIDSLTNKASELEKLLLAE